MGVMILADQRTEDASGPPKVADRRCRSTDNQQATTMNKVLINRHSRRVNKYFIFVLALTLNSLIPVGIPPEFAT
jgi:hypothetical protein